MGGGITFLSKKSFNPSNWSNQRRVWEARQNSESERRRIVEREAQIKREREEEELARVVGGDEEGGRKALGFMYDGGKIPGLQKAQQGKNHDGDGDDGDDDGHDTNSRGDNEQNNLFQRQPGDDDAAAAFRAMLAQGAAKGDEEKQSCETKNQPPDGNNDVNVQDDSNNNAKETTDTRTNLEKAVGRGINGSGVTLAQQMERFPMLKSAPMVLKMGKKTDRDDQAATTIGMNFKPLGINLRNVQCMACKKWGHTRGDRECELSGWDPFCIQAAASSPAAPTNMSARDTTTTTTTTFCQPAHKSGQAGGVKEEEAMQQKSRKRRKKRHKSDRYERKKKSKKHKRHRRDRSPSYSSYSSSDSYYSDGMRYRGRREGRLR